MLAAGPTTLRRLGATLVRELGKFGVIGGVAFVVDVGLFNLLRYGALGADGWLDEKPLTAKVLSMGTATLVAWAGNRWWTFRSRRHGRSRRVLPELLLFFTMNGVALGIALLCLGVSHYVLDLRTALADNVAANVVGVGLGTVFRFYAYRTWVFRRTADGERVVAGAPPAAAVIAGAAVPRTEPAASSSTEPAASFSTEPAAS